MTYESFELIIHRLDNSPRIGLNYPTANALFLNKLNANWHDYWICTCIL